MSHFIRVKRGLGVCCCYRYQHILNAEKTVHLAHGSLDGSIDFTLLLGTGWHHTLSSRKHILLEEQVEKCLLRMTRRSLALSVKGNSVFRHRGHPRTAKKVYPYSNLFVTTSHDKNKDSLTPNQAERIKNSIIIKKPVWMHSLLSILRKPGTIQVRGRENTGQTRSTLGWRQRVHI